jgi:3-isopropylmalate/(R)-2-methylmalate dehydratase small subunit
MRTISGRVRRFGDDVDTDQIIPAEYLLSENLDHLGDFAFSKARPDLDLKQNDIIVAGKNFGCGSSREHAPLALKQAGVACVVAESFGRIFFRNSINIGLPVVECDATDLNEGDTVAVDLAGGVIRCGGREYRFEKLPDFLMRIIDAGGLMNTMVGGGR